MSILNYTPHDINAPGGKIYATGIVIRCRESVEPLPFWIERVPLVSKSFGELYAEKDGVEFPLPEDRAVEGLFLVVSAMVQAAAPNRLDLLVPSDFTRDDKGNITGCKSFTITPALEGAMKNGRFCGFHHRVFDGSCSDCEATHKPDSHTSFLSESQT